MTRLASLAVISVVGFVAVNAAYQKSNATYAVDMECANCIRSGNNYCLWIGGTGNGTIQTWNCTQDDKTWDITSAGGEPGGSMCSKGSDDQMNAIVNGCRPWLNQNHNDYCGPYIVDLTDSNSFSVGRSVQEMPVNSSCTYRAMSNCGYPEANFRIHNSTYHADFDVAWASKDGVNSDNDLDGWQRKAATTLLSRKSTTNLAKSPFLVRMLSPSVMLNGNPAMVLIETSGLQSPAPRTALPRLLLMVLPRTLDSLTAPMVVPTTQVVLSTPFLKFPSETLREAALFPPLSALSSHLLWYSPSHSDFYFVLA